MNTNKIISYVVVALIAVLVLIVLFMLLEGPVPPQPMSAINNCLQYVIAPDPCPTPTPLPWWQFWGH